MCMKTFSKKSLFIYQQFQQKEKVYKGIKEGETTIYRVCFHRWIILATLVHYLHEKKNTHQKRRTAKRSGPTSAEKIKLQF